MSQKTPYNIRIEKARNYLRYQINAAATQYDLSGPIIDLILEGLIAEEQSQRMALVTEQYDNMEHELEQKEKELAEAREENERCQELVKNLNKSEEPDTEKRSEEQSTTP